MEKIVFTEQEKTMLAAFERDELVLACDYESFPFVCLLATHYKQEADILRAQLETAKEELESVKKERDELAGYVEEWTFEPTSDFDKALMSLARDHANICSDGVPQNDALHDKAIADRRLLQAWELPLARIEKNLMSPCPDLTALAYEAVLALSYEMAEEDDEADDGEPEKKSPQPMKQDYEVRTIRLWETPALEEAMKKLSGHP